MSENNVKIYAFADEADCMIDGQIIAMKRNNLNGLEIRNVDGENIADISIEKAKEVKKKLDDNQLCVWSLGSPIGKIGIKDAFAPHLDKFKHCLEIANELDCKNIRLFSFYIPEDDNPEIYKDEVFERLSAFVDTAKSSGINLCHENEKGIYGDTAKRCYEILTTFPTIKGIFDPANYIQCDENTLLGWNLLRDYTYYLHVKDALFGGEVVPAGEGDGNVRFIINDFVSHGGTALTIEPHLTIFDGLKSLEREGETSAVSQFRYPDANTAFDVACNAVNKFLKR